MLFCKAVLKQSIATARHSCKVMAESAARILQALPSSDVECISVIYIRMTAIAFLQYAGVSRTEGNYQEEVRSGCNQRWWWGWLCTKYWFQRGRAWSGQPGYSCNLLFFYISLSFALYSFSRMWYRSSSLKGLSALVQIPGWLTKERFFELRNLFCTDVRQA